MNFKSGHAWFAPRRLSVRLAAQRRRPSHRRFHQSLRWAREKRTAGHWRRQKAATAERRSGVRQMTPTNDSDIDIGEGGKYAHSNRLQLSSMRKRGAHNYRDWDKSRCDKGIDQERTYKIYDIF